MTIDLGFNNMLPCLADHQVNETCVLQNLATVRQQLAQILSTLREKALPCVSSALAITTRIFTCIATALRYGLLLHLALR